MLAQADSARARTALRAAGGGARGGARGGGSPKSAVLEDFADHLISTRFNEGNDLHRPPVLGAHLWIDMVNPPHRHRPTPPGIVRRARLEGSIPRLDGSITSKTARPTTKVFLNPPPPDHGTLIRENQISSYSAVHEDRRFF
jgi:hypothetical protein